MSIKNIQFIEWMLLIAGVITLVVTMITMIGGGEGPTKFLVFMGLIFGPTFLITGIIGLKKAGPNVITFADIRKILIIASIILIVWSVVYSVVFRSYLFQSCLKQNREEKIKVYGYSAEKIEHICNINYPKNPILYFFR